MKGKQKGYTDKTVEIRSIDNDEDEEGKKKKVIAGYAVLYDIETQRSWHREKIQAGCFDNWISKRENVVKAFWNHNSDMVLGSTRSGTLKLNSDKLGLGFEVELSEATFSNDCYMTVNRGDVDGTSFGFVPVKTMWDDSNRENPLRIVVEAELYEISPCTFPQYEGASSVSTRSIEDEYKEFLERNNKNIDAGNNLLRHKYKFL